MAINMSNPMFAPENLLKMSAAMFAAPTFAQGLGGATDALSTSMTAQKQQQKEEALRNQTAEMLAKNAPDIAEVVRTGALSASDGLRLYYQQKKEAADAAKPKFMTVDGKIIKLDETTGANSVVGDYSGPAKPNLISTRNGIYDADSKQWISAPEGVQDGNTAEHGLNPIWGKKDGKLIFGTLDKAGVFHETELPPGFEPQPGTSTVDLGTTVVVRNNKTGDTIREMPKDIAGVEMQKEIGSNEGKQTAAAPGDLQAGLNAKALIEELKTDPNREWGTGWSSVTGNIPGTPAYDYQTKVNQAKSGAFLTAIQQMRGLGALSNAEGQTATAAVTRMNTATSEGEFLDALDDYEKIIDQGITKAKSRIPSQSTQTQDTTTSGVNRTTTGVKWKVPGQ